jgi:hypothetical protein
MRAPPEPGVGNQGGARTGNETARMRKIAFHIDPYANRVGNEVAKA